MALSKKITRSEFDCPIFGYPKELPVSKLPSYEDVLKCFFLEHYNLAVETNNKLLNNNSFSQISNIVAPKVKQLFDKASIPTVSLYRIVQMINAYNNSYRSLMKSYKRDKEKDSFKKKVEEFKQKSLRLFDISACKCTITLDCNCRKAVDLCECPVSIVCTCEKSKKVPVIELKFLYLQRKHSLGKIGNVDVKESKKIIQRQKRKNTEYSRCQSNVDSLSQPSCSKTMEPTQIEDFDSTEINRNEDSSDEVEEFEPVVKTPWQMRVKLTNTALTSDRFGVSDRATAAIASSLLQDFGIITETEHSNVIDKNKIRRGKKVIRTELQVQNQAELNTFQGLYFDGRKDDTIVIEKVNSKHFRRVIKEEHYSIIQEPGSVYVGHVTPCSGSAQNIADSIISYLKKTGLSLDDLDVIGCDGTVTNTGWKGGVIRTIEEKVKRPMQWAVCLLHFNELPLRHLFQFLDGDTTGPTTFKGPIGTELNNCEKLPLVKFASVECEIPDIDRSILSKDQQYLLDISSAVQSGICPIDLSHREPGPLSHARWLTMANRILRLYVSVEYPSDEHKIVVHFILKSYMPVWFNIKKSKYLTDGPEHIFQTVKSSRFLPENLLQVIDPVIERNAYFAHPENLMLSMIVDKRTHIRELGLRRIIKARTSAPKRKSIRAFHPPKLNFQATEYSELIDWTATTLSPPPLLRRISNEEIRAKILTGDTAAEWRFDKFPCHTQAVERCIKLVTSASQKVVGFEARDGLIRTTLQSRAAMPCFESKSAFKLPKQE